LDKQYRSSDDGDGEGGAGGRRADAVLQRDGRGEAVADGGAGGSDIRRRRLAGDDHAGATGRQQQRLPSSQRILPLISRSSQLHACMLRWIDSFLCIYIGVN